MGEFGDSTQIRRDQAVAAAERRVEVAIALKTGDSHDVVVHRRHFSTHFHLGLPHHHDLAVRLKCKAVSLFTLATKLNPHLSTRAERRI